MKETDVVRVELRPSNLLTGWLAGLHAATLLPLWWSALPVWTGVAAVAIIAAHGTWTVLRYGRLQRPRSITGITLRIGQDCTLFSRDGREFIGTVEGSTLVLSILVVLAVKRTGAIQVRHVIIVPDMIALEDFRRLRVGLKWGGSQVPDSRHA